jgi:hypothetical protein
VAAPTTTVVTTAGTTALPAMIDTETIVIRTIAHLSVGIVLGHLVGLNTKNVAPGLRPPGGRLTIEGLQGTMITGGEAMMIAEGLIIMLTDAGTILTDAGTTENATRKMTAMKSVQGMQTVMAVGLVEMVRGSWFPDAGQTGK